VTASRRLNYALAVQAVCVNIVSRLPEFAAVRMERVGISFCRTRNNERFGVWASMSPLRFENGLEICERNAVRWRMPVLQIRKKDLPLLYVLSIYVPRFFDLSLIEKIETLVHELYHISPDFNGDIRRFPGRHYAHGNKADYQKTVSGLAKKWLATDPAPELWNFLRYDAAGLSEHYGRVYGQKITIPAPVRIED